MPKTKDTTVRTITQSYPENHGKLGKRIEIGSTAHVSLNKSGMRVEFLTPAIQCVIGIGNDHVAYLLMDEDAWKALKKGQEINIDSIKQFTKQFL